MAVYVTRSMLDRMNQLQYPSSCKFDNHESSTPDHWQKLFTEGNKSIKLSHAMICRVCGRDGCTPITENIDDFSILVAIRTISNVSVDSDDSLPKFICTDCLEKLKVAMEFKKICEASERKFKKIVNPMGCKQGYRYLTHNLLRSSLVCQDLHRDPSLHSYPYSKHDFQQILHDMKMKKIKIEEEKEKERQARVRNTQKPKGKEFKCSSCDMTFPGRELLSKHRRERLCMRRACEVCGQLVVSIKQHMRQIHKQPVSHKCPSCDKEFPVFARLKNHMLIHTDTFNFFCDLCPYKCKHKYYLVMHMRTHTGEKPYKCQLCPATFVNPSNLNKHKLTHQEKQFKCMLCEKAFRTNAGLREHHEAAHMHIKHTCNYCGRDFCYRSDLRKHEIRNHNRTKRDYIGGEPTYKQVERMQKLQEQDEIEKWHPHEIQVVQTQPQIIQATYIDTSKDYRQTSQAIYFSDVAGLMTQQPIHQMVSLPQQTVEISLPELTLKKDDVKIAYETQQGIGYYQVQ